MPEQDKQIAESIRSGAYFVQARGWYETLYIGPISERTFFIIIAFLAVLVAFFSVSGVMRLLPITDRNPVLVYATDRPDDVHMSLLPLTKRQEPVNPAILEFFVTQYVIAREGYFSQTFVANARFVRAQSNVNAYNAYATAYSPTNPQSPIASLGEYGQRLVTIYSVQISPIVDGKGTANVIFSAETKGGEVSSTTNWTAKLDYIYKELITKPVDNPKTGNQELQITDPQFQVVNYVLQQNP